MLFLASITDGLYNGKSDGLYKQGTIVHLIVHFSRYILIDWYFKSCVSIYNIIYSISKLHTKTLILLNIVSKQPPVVVMHGIMSGKDGMNNMIRFLKDVIPDLYVLNCEVGNGYNMILVDTTCEQTLSVPKPLRLHSIFQIDIISCASQYNPPNMEFTSTC
ncbi:Palmitoyl-protein_thioesterase [Hexamita inflata]|uniref:Palmitoyl-protein_thioesterase n=1 Tax=Hexamita inflata TaxID=28002 RepID=A0ABP1GYW1_9EUKA